MLLWLIIALGFIACVAAWHLWQGITWEEAGALFIASALIFAFQLHYIYKKATTDHYIISGYVTSLIHRPAFSYHCGKNSTCHEPERWIVEQGMHPAARILNFTRPIHGGDGIEGCYGECAASYPAPYTQSDCCTAGNYFYGFLVDSKKFNRTTLGDTSSVWKDYYNPVLVSDDVVYNGADDKIPYFIIYDYNNAQRLVAPHVTSLQIRKIESINAALADQNISLGLIITQDNLFFEKLKRAWHRGKANDFVIVVNTLDGKTINNVNVLAWDNYTLQENIADALSGLVATDIDGMLATIDTTLKQGPPYATTDFSKYRFLQVKIPTQSYVKILTFQLLFFVYMLFLMKNNPNTKEYKLTWAEIGKMWEKNFTPPNRTWYLHPLTESGLFLYFVVPSLVFRFLFWY